MKDSPQNNPLRLYLSFFESGINLFYPSKSPNELSFLGLNKVKQAVDIGYKKDILSKFIAIILYASGVSLDLLDGIRARKNPSLVTEEGQLIDGYCDRMREIIPLRERATLRSSISLTAMLTTYFTILSCLLPSIARAQVESTGKTVKEKDMRGGSSYNRAIRLIKSFTLDILGFKKLSQKTDEIIYYSNIATYRNRKAKTDAFSWKIKMPNRKAYERLLLYVELLQKEYESILAKLEVYPNQQQLYREKTKNFMKDFIEIDIKTLRKINGIKNFDLKS